MNLSRVLIKELITELFAINRTQTTVEVEQIDEIIFRKKRKVTDESENYNSNEGVYRSHGFSDA